MTNLIPLEGKKLVKKEYVLRIFAVWSLLLTGVLVALSFMLLPTHVLLIGRLDALSLEYNELIAEDVSQYQDAREAIKEANILAARLNFNQKTALPYEITKRINDVLSTNVTLLGFLYSNNDGELDVQIRGTAATREALVTFIDKLKRDPLFTEATIPVSDLAREINLTFTAVLAIRNQ